MKRVFLFVLVFFGIYPVFRNSEFQIAGPETASCQNASHILMRYLEKKDGTKYYYLPVQHNCGCAVAQYANTGEFVQFHYATKEFYKITPEFQAFIDSAGMDNPYYPLVKLKKLTAVKKKEPEKKEGGVAWIGVLMLLHCWGYRYRKKLVVL